DVVRLVVWGSVTVLLIVWTWLATSTAEGVTTDLGGAPGRVRVAGRELLLALAQVAAVFVPLAVAIVLAVQQRWRRLALVAAAGVAARAVFGHRGCPLGA